MEGRSSYSSKRADGHAYTFGGYVCSIGQGQRLRPSAKKYISDNFECFCFDFFAAFMMFFIRCEKLCFFPWSWLWMLSLKNSTWKSNISRINLHAKTLNIAQIFKIGVVIGRCVGLGRCFGHRCRFARRHCFDHRRCCWCPHHGWCEIRRTIHPVSLEKPATDKIKLSGIPHESLRNLSCKTCGRVQQCKFAQSSNKNINCTYSADCSNNAWW